MPMSEQHTFQAVIEAEGSGGAYITIPFDVEQVFGKKRVKVKATIDGEPYRGSLVRMGGDCHRMGILKEIRIKLGKGFGELVSVTLEEDTEPRLVVPPADLLAALENHPEAKAFFEQLSYTHQKEYVQWIEETKRQETRQARIARSIEMLQQGKKTR